MNTACKSALIAACLLPAACATTDSARLAGQASIRDDNAYMDAVEQKAKPAGVRVVWVNPPKRRDE